MPAIPALAEPAARAPRLAPRLGPLPFLGAATVGLAISVAYSVLLFWNLHPLFLTDEINRRLATVPGHHGGVLDARAGLFPPRVTVSGLRFAKDIEAAPFVSIAADRLTVTLSPGDLWRGVFAGRVAVDAPDAKFLMRQRRPGQPRRFGLWQKFCAGLPPFAVRELVVRGGRLRIRNDEDIPRTDIFFDRINAAATNLANRRGLRLPGPARVSGTGRLMDHAPLWMAVEATPYEPHATYRFQGRLRGFQLKTLNHVLRHYTGTDIEAGTMDIDGDLAARDGRFSGRVSRRLVGLDVIRRHERHLGFIQRTKEFIFEIWLGRQAKRGALDAEYALHGPLGYMDQDVFLAWVWVAKTAFLQSIRPVLPEAVAMGAPEQAEEEWMALQAREREKLAGK